ncbi:MAG: Pycsar system effector family protein [Actinomycetota bacterium]
MNTAEEYGRRLLGETREEISRADTKASIVLAGAGVIVGIVLTGFVTGDISLSGQRVGIHVLVMAAGALSVAGILALGAAVYPRTKSPEPGHARYFEEISQFTKDEKLLRKTVDDESGDAFDRDVNQMLALSGIVHSKYKLTRIGMQFLGLGLVLAGLALVLWN